MGILNSTSDPKSPLRHVTEKHCGLLEGREPERSSRLILGEPPAADEIARWDEDGGASARQISLGWNRQAASLPPCVDVADAGEAVEHR
ncbi:hypothetical protein [Methylobacterium nigriterrae]|uniref:hypothetical protein n=1 Tax=Methylobacterium nigriterrae TaxID=3127512 RepID=UPI003013C6D8